MASFGLGSLAKSQTCASEQLQVRPESQNHDDSKDGTCPGLHILSEEAKNGEKKGLIFSLDILLT
jgi:hypothetical protein